MNLNHIFHRVLSDSRKKTIQHFFLSMNPQISDVILDLGAAGDQYGEQPFFEDDCRWKENIIGVNIEINELLSLRRKYREIALILADGCNLPFQNNSISILFSNAVIEHVGNLRQQERFAHEVMRVSQRWFVVTPNFWFPIETHWKLPFIHYLPEKTQRKIFHFGQRLFLAESPKSRSRSPGRITKFMRRYFSEHGWYGEGLHLLSATKLRILFPGSQIEKLRTTFYPEVLVAHLS